MPVRDGSPVTPDPRLLDRFERSSQSPRLLMLYPPVATGQPYSGVPDAQRLWAGSSMEGTLYVHVPFCHTRCVFCPFYAVVAAAGDLEAYVDAVLAEAALYADAVSHIRFTSVYVGGGTPTVLPPPLVERLLNGLGSMVRIDGAQVTAEAHPAHVNAASVRALRAAGVGRLSIGVQSFNDRVLEACGRGDTIGRVIPAVAAALGAGFSDVNIDLMYGLPEQGFSTWQHDLERAVRLGVPGLTLYSTVYLPPFRSQSESRGFTIASDADRLSMYADAFEFLGQAGYHQPRYGAGAFLRTDLNAHRRNVSLGLPTLGLGTWAYSSSGAFSYHNLFPTQAWMAAVRADRLPIRQLVTVPPAERPRKYMVEAMLLAYVDLAHFRDAFGVELADAFPEELAVLDHLDLARIEDGELRLTRKGGRHLREIRYLFASEAIVQQMEREGAEGL